MTPLLPQPLGNSTCMRTNCPRPHKGVKPQGSNFKHSNCSSTHRHLKRVVFHLIYSVTGKAYCTAGSNKDHKLKCLWGRYCKKDSSQKEQWGGALKRNRLNHLNTKYLVEISKVHRLAHCCDFLAIAWSLQQPLHISSQGFLRVSHCTEKPNGSMY